MIPASPVNLAKEDSGCQFFTHVHMHEKLVELNFQVTFSPSRAAGP